MPAADDIRDQPRPSAGQPEGSLFQDGVAPVPQREPQAEALVDIAEASEGILTPPVCTRTGVIVGEVVPCGAVCALVLPHGAALALAHVRTP